MSFLEIHWSVHKVVTNLSILTVYQTTVSRAIHDHWKVILLTLVLPSPSLRDVWNKIQYSYSGFQDGKSNDLSFIATRLRHLVYVLSWGANGPKLLCAGLWLNTCKSESCLEQWYRSTEDFQFVLDSHEGGHSCLGCGTAERWSSISNVALMFVENLVHSITSVQYCRFW